VVESLAGIVTIVVWCLGIVSYGFEKEPWSHTTSEEVVIVIVGRDRLDDSGRVALTANWRDNRA
jgi:hypothetical protein